MGFLGRNIRGVRHRQELEYTSNPATTTVRHSLVYRLGTGPSFSSCPANISHMTFYPNSANIMAESDPNGRP